jgi:hypothetical protein
MVDVFMVLVMLVIDELMILWMILIKGQLLELLSECGGSKGL